MSISEELAAEAMHQTQLAFQGLPGDATVRERMEVVRAASSLLERLEVKSLSVSRLGDSKPTEGVSSPA